jgi:phosphodiesterase/alkaline phosphatase D-like protein
MNTFDTASPFRHGVASGDPLPDSVIIWTRVSTRLHQPIEVTWTMACDSEFSEVVATGTVETSVDADYTVKADVHGLKPDHTYFYRFAAQDRISPTGRTRTLPGDEANHLRFAQVSCAKFNAGFFNAYARIAERNDLHFLLHLGDYIYEASNTPPPSQTPGADIGRPFDPLHECRTLDDYRRRYAQYHLDPDVQCVHASLPLIAVLDDHELADGAWRGGASEHKEERDGPWVKRHHDALRARWNGCRCVCLMQAIRCAFGSNYPLVLWRICCSLTRVVTAISRSAEQPSTTRTGRRSALNNALGYWMH